MAKTNDILREVELHGTDSLKYIVYKPKEGIHDILNEGLKVDDQIWTRPTFPDFSKLSKAECQALYIREIRRIRFGVYCWIGGDLEYISGKHYFGLTHWLLKDSSSEYLIYTQTQRDIFYFLELCDKDIRCAGAIIFSLKRLGKSEIAQIEMYGEGLLSDSGVFIVQALNDDEAADIFGKTHYANENLHNTLPIWKYITSKKEEPEKNLVAFKRDSTVDSITWKSADGSSGNNSSVSFMVKPTKLSGIQGKKLKRGFLDEFASLKPVKDMTLANYHAKAIAQSTEDFGSIVVGKVWLIATAENLESEALIDAKEIWDNSAEDRKDANGYNISMMKRMFVPYYLGGRGVDFIDKFGRPKIEDAKAWYANKLASMSDSAKTLFRRQNPETIADVFEIENKGGLEIDVIEIIKQRKRELLLQRKAQPLYDISKYNGQVILSPASKEGQFTLELFENPEEHHLYRVGIDATSTAINSTNKAANGGEKGKEKSKFAIVVHRITGDNQYVDVANLWVRPEKRHLIEKAGLWLCQYFNKYGGCRAYPERNASAGSTLTDLFEAEGEQRILIRQLKKHNTDKLMEKSTDAYGIYIDGNNKDYRTSVMNKYLRLHGHKINSIRVIDNLLMYGLENADLADAYGVGTMACGNFDAEVKEEKKQVQKIYYENVLTGSGRFQRVKRVINVQEK